MGYTHYVRFTEPLTQEAFDAIKADVKEIEKVVPLYDGGGEKDGVDFESDGFWFNGDDSVGDSHETFSLRVNQFGFDFCKTNRKPYDKAVVMTLLSLKEHFGDGVKVTSDGDLDDWETGIEAYKELFTDREIKHDLNK